MVLGKVVVTLSHSVNPGKSVIELTGLEGFPRGDYSHQIMMMQGWQSRQVSIQVLKCINGKDMVVQAGPRG